MKKNMVDVNFGKILCREYEGNGTYVTFVENAEYCEFESYSRSISDSGYKTLYSRTAGNAEFRGFYLENDAIFLSYYPDIKEMRIVTEPDSPYLSFKYSPGEPVCPVSVTHVDIEDYGLSYIIKLSDSRFVVFDGGWDIESFADRLYEALILLSGDKKPEIAAWIFTHPHIDHYRCFLPFNQKYSDKVEIHRVICNFPECTEDTIKQMPGINKDDFVCMTKVWEICSSLSIPIYRAHTGQIYEFGDVSFEVLSSPDDTLISPVTDINPLSLVLRMSAARQSVLWCADTYFKEAKLAARYGAYLKSDILQLPHHGFCGGEKDEYKLIDPMVCLAPVGERECLQYIDFYYDYNRYLFCSLNLRELICGGGGNVTLTLPHIPDENGKTNLLSKIAQKQKGVGSKDWYFMDYTKEETTFSFVNVTYSTVTIMANLYFEKETDNVYYIKLSVPPRTAFRKNILTECDADEDESVLNPYPLAKKGVPEDKLFTVHFTSDIPVVIKGERPADYSY